MEITSSLLLPSHHSKIADIYFGDTRYISLQRRFDLQILQPDGEPSFPRQRRMEGDARDRVGVHGHLRQRGEDRRSNSEERASGEALPSAGGHAPNGNSFNGHPAKFVPSGSRRGRHYNHETHPSRKLFHSLRLLTQILIESSLLSNPLFPRYRSWTITNRGKNNGLAYKGKASAPRWSCDPVLVR